jgi:hypothetical protein
MPSRLMAFALLVASSTAAHASEEEIHEWKQVSITVDTNLFGEVTVQAVRSAGRVGSLTVKLGKDTVTVSTDWLKRLPPLRITSIEVRSERGYDPKPWLYIVFATDKPQQKGYVAIQDGKLVKAFTITRDDKGQMKLQDHPPVR